MKTNLWLNALGILLAIAALAQAQETSQFSIVERGGHHRVWQSVTTETDAKGSIHYRTNSYTELETGMHYLKDGEWLESREEIEIVPEGAVARHGRHQVIFSANCNSPVAIDMLTPDGKRLQSRVLGLAYFDSASGKMVWIAETKDSIGQLLGANQVVYIDAFTAFKAHLRYTYTKAGFEQDVILREKPPTPGKFGLNPATTRLQVMTEFLNPPTPKVETRQVDGGTDERLDFGDMAMGSGKAFALLGDANSIPVNKGWGTLDGRVFLVEEVSYPLLEPLLRTLPVPQASLSPPKGKLYAVSTQRQLPPVQTVKRKSTQPMMVASVPLSGQGVVLDYTTLSSATNYTFQGDTTYYVSGTVNLSSTTTIEGGAVIKYTNLPSAKLLVSGSLVFKTSPYRPAIFTSKDDNTVGETISGSTGVPTNYNGGTYLAGGNGNTTYKFLRMSYAGTGIDAGLGSSTMGGVWHCQFVRCVTCLHVDDDDGYLYDVLFSKCGTVLGLGANNVKGSHITADQINTLYASFHSLKLTNSILTAVTNLGNGVTLYNCVTNSSGAGIYQTVGAGSYYLVNNSTNRNSGTTNIHSSLLSDLKKLTTFPPQFWTNNFATNTTLSVNATRGGSIPDLGYAYPPLDYVVSGRLLTNSTLTLSNGVVLGTYGASTSYGISIVNNGKIVSTGTPDVLNWVVRYNTVQEQSTTNWSATSVAPSIKVDYDTAQAQFRFTGFSMPGGTGDHFNGTLTTANYPWFRDCQFGGGTFNTKPSNVALTNCLWDRVDITLDDDTYTTAWYLYNNLFRGGKLTYRIRGSSPVAMAYDNLFDKVTITKGTGSDPFTHGYNGYYSTTVLSGSTSSNVTLTNIDYQIGTLGNYYYPSNGIAGGLTNLLNAGSRYATNAGLYHYTTTTNQVKEGSTKVDIGFHYVAADTNGVPIDTDGDGIPDYLEDANGNGVFDTGDLTDFNSFDTDGDGLSDLYEMQVTHTDPNNPDTGNTGISDGYQDADNDGWTNVQEAQNLTDPNAFNSPPPPKAVNARLDATGTNVILSWVTGGGPVISYVIERTDLGSTPIVTNNSTTFTHTDSPDFDSFGTDKTEPVYQIRALFSGGVSSVSEIVGVQRPSLTLDAKVVRGPGGLLFLAVAALPQDVARIRLFWSTLLPNPGDSNHPWFEIAASNLVSGVVQLSPQQTERYPAYILWMQAISTAGEFGGPVPVGPFIDETASFPSQHTFVDATAHIKQNLNFLLRSATASRAFGYDASGHGTSSPEHDFARAASPSTYEYSGYRTFSPDLDYTFLDELLPIQQHYLWRNYVFASTNFNGSGDFATGADYDAANAIRILSSPQYQFSGAASNSPPAPLSFSTTNSTWLYHRWIANAPIDTAANADVGVYANASTNLYVPNGAVNIYGLPFNSVRVSLPGGSFATFNAGGAASVYAPDALEYFPEVAVPNLQTVGYYFVSQTPHFKYGAARPPVPGSPDFSVTNTTPLLIASVGQPYTVAGWAKQAITNGSAGKYAYLEQYFDKAFKTDTSGAALTNETGILSPYGEFFPTEPGRALLVTLPDIDTGQRGTGLVYVIKMELDVNHDGNMDRTFAGADNTSYYRPFTFWVNDDNDSLTGNDVVALWRYDYDDNIIGYQRDLEDFARLWISGLPSLSTTNGYTISLFWRSTTDNPAIKLYSAAEADGATSYLQDTNIAAEQINYVNTYGVLSGPGASLGTVSSGTSFAFPTDYFQTFGRKHFLFEGAGTGKGELVLSITRSNQIVSETSVFIELKNIKQMFERWSVGEVGSIEPTNAAYLATEGLPIGSNPFQYAHDSFNDTNTSYILHVHGWNQTTARKDLYAETAFKRLYWQGYQGRFGAFRWPTYNGFDSLLDVIFDPNNYDKSEWHGWKSAVGLRNLLTNLNQEYPNQVRICAHSMGNIVVGEALRVTTNAPLPVVYVAMQAAVPAHLYDAGATTRLVPVGADDGTPNRYAQYYQSGFPPYHFGYGGTNIYVNFFNASDYALDAWTIDQNLKPAGTFGYSYSQGSGKFYRNSTELLFPTNTHEIFSFCVEARCYALGAQTNVAGPFDLQAQINLNSSTFAFGDQSDGHSGQFLFTNVRCWQFWDELLKTFELKPR